MKGQPLAYNKDNQEDKEPLFDTVETLTLTLRIYADMITGITVKPEAMRSAALQGYATATDLADYLVKKGLPFRDAHEAVAQAVRFAEQRGCDLGDISIAELRQFFNAHRRRCVSSAVAGRLARQPQPHRRNRTESGSGGYRQGAQQSRQIIPFGIRGCGRDKVSSFLWLRSMGA